MELLYLFERIRTPWLDSIMLGITELGGEIFFMALAIVLFWCIDKRAGYYVLTTGFVGTVVNQFLKITFRVSRPWVRDPQFTIVEGARAAANGYSFPSGHAQNAATVFGCLALMLSKRWIKIMLWAAYGLVVISRMYLGVHTPWDVGISVILGLGLCFGLRPLFVSIDKHPKRMYGLLLGMIVMATAFAVYVEAYPFPLDIEADNLANARKNAYTLLGAVSGMATAYWLDTRYIHFSVRGSFPAQLIKSGVGLALIVALRVVLKFPLKALFDGHAAADAVRYYLIVVFAAAAWPLAFPWICRRFPDRK